MKPPAMLHLNDITLRVAGRPLLEGATLHLPAGQRAALVGRNGTGKSTLLRLIAGELQPDQGDVRLQSRARIGYVAQEAPAGTRTPLEVVLAADTERASLLEEARTATDPLRIAEVQARLVDIRADAAPARAARILLGLGFDKEAQERPLSSFSGGWRMRVALAGVLFVEPDFLILDEPTNHLDLEATMWLEDHLRRYPRTLLVVSHDRDLLNAVPERIIHLDQQKLTTYSGNYDIFARTRAEKMMVQEKTRERQEAARAHMQAFVDRFRYKASKARQAQSRLKMLEKMPLMEAAAREPEVRFAFPAKDVPPPPMITMDRAATGYGEKIVLTGLDMRIDPDDRIALLGANGNGKSTFAKLVAGRLQPLAGEIVRARGLRIGFFAQHQTEELEPEESSIRHVLSRQPQRREQEVRGLLARFGLGAAKAETKAKHLSGGEKTRLAMALMCLDEPHMLILDEPTNHLDIDSCDALAEAINEFPGAVIVISHDRHLVEMTADRLLLVGNGRVETYEGDVADYRDMLMRTERGQHDGQPAARADRISGAAKRSKLAPLRKEAKELEREIGRLDGERAKLQAKLADPGSYAAGIDMAGLQREINAIGKAVDAAEARWLELEAQIEELAAA
ncbi:ATP-binding cassette, subfamily F, member 3 [Arboricoccus pini]|uniref:ATP-binding cassette, subfamily F, member 3 n=1 Tax=Arboricoccus pini TaxID=1963835 RepID=A0A212PZL2_9PROT|nr:ABC-F family ATP-binding cassette domain-containing protein [Arboricoccus pini]SNB52486.1 ATP-binding cassette, subfamily F, member 3 [Arboricoccus pini]